MPPACPYVAASMSPPCLNDVATISQRVSTMSQACLIDVATLLQLISIDCGKVATSLRHRGGIVEASSRHQREKTLSFSPTMSQACPKHTASDFLWSEMLRHGGGTLRQCCDIILKVLQENIFSHVATIFSVFCGKSASRCSKLATCLRHG